jgi:hypothetical protein
MRLGAGFWGDAKSLMRVSTPIILETCIGLKSTEDHARTDRRT